MNYRLVALALLLALVSTHADEPQPAKIDPGTFTVTLSDGLKLQVLGICEHPSEGQPWWKPDGSRLDERPYEKLDGHVGIESGLMREFAIRIFDQPKSNDTVYVDFKPPQRSRLGTSADNPKLGRITADALALPEGATTESVIFRCATGQWQTRNTTTTGGSSTGGTEGNYAWGRARSSKGHTSIAVVHDIKDSDVRVLAIDSAGKEHDSGSSFASGVKDVIFGEYEFDLAPEKIKEFRLQSRPFDTEVEFSNISLNKDAATEVKIEVRGATPSE